MHEEINAFFQSKKVLVTGGTGSFGHQIVNRLLKTQVSEIVVFSRDEKKQYDMRQEISDSRVKFMVGDVRDADRVSEAIDGHVNIVYHAAALKQVPYCEDYPLEAVKTNIIGAVNVRRASIQAGVELVVAVSTDKAVKPVNVMGMTKAIQEKIFINTPSPYKHPKFICVRYGNVLGSRGSVVPLFFHQLEMGLPLTITHNDMTRFMLTLKESVELVFHASLYGNSGDLFVKKMPSYYVRKLAEIMISMNPKYQSCNYPIKEIGIRPGEKIHEILVSEEEMHRALEDDQYFMIGKNYVSNYGNNGKEFCSGDEELIMEGYKIERMLRKEGFAWD